MSRTAKIAGVAGLAGLMMTVAIVAAVAELHDDDDAYARMAEAGYPYGGSGAGERIAVLLGGK